jgi:predicted DCC family thiol-disulfide oxidoreductase YuxK
MNTAPVTVYYDGLCPLCSREIEHYRRRSDADVISYVDIAAPEFDASDHGLDPIQIHRELHVKRGSEILTGVAAFIAIWQVVRGFRWLGTVVRTPGIHAAARLAYAVFCRVRPWLPRRACATGTCTPRV